MDTTLNKIDDITFEEVVVTPEQEVRVQGTLESVMADIAGTQAWLDKAQQEVLDATAQLVALNTKKIAIEALGVVTSVPEPEPELEPEPTPE